MDSFKVTSDARKHFSTPMDLCSLTFRPSETGSAHFPWSAVVYFDPWHQGVPFLLILDGWSLSSVWPQAGSVLSAGWMEPFLFPSESRPITVWGWLPVLSGGEWASSSELRLLIWGTAFWSFTHHSHSHRALKLQIRGSQQPSPHPRTLPTMLHCILGVLWSLPCAREELANDSKKKKSFWKSKRWYCSCIEVTGVGQWCH